MKKLYVCLNAIILTCSTLATSLPKCSQAPYIDGEAEAVWDEARSFPLVNFFTDRPPLTMDTTGRLMYDDHSLYIFVDCREVNLVEARDQARFDRHDASVWENGCVEIFLDTRNNGRSYYQFVVDIHGTTADLLHYDPDGPSNALDWNGYWRSAIGTSDDGWTLEVAIPWRTVGVAPGTLDRLGFNLSRARRIAPYERSTLTVGASSFHSLAHFPVVEGLQIALPVASGEIHTGPVFLGNNRMNLTMRNNTEKEQSGELELVGISAEDIEVLRQAMPLTLAPGEERDLAIDYMIEQTGRVQISASFIQNGVSAFLDLADYSFRQPMELNDRFPMVFAGRNHSMFVRLFVPKSDDSILEITIQDGQGADCANLTLKNPSPEAFITLPTAGLVHGNYMVRFALKQDGTTEHYQSETELKVIRPL